MIYPTLFVGLGSTGLDILQKLQDLVNEEYKERLPIFSYIYLETEDGKKPDKRPGMRDEITVPKTFPVIHNLAALRDEYVKGQKSYLDAWMNEKLLEFPGRAFNAGAGHIRMAGRLCLWENWQECTRILTDAKATITGLENIARTSQFLRGFYERVNQPQPAGAQLVGSDPNVYVFGTLCGGTCGGMLLDVAYFLRELFGLRTNRQQAKLQGIFTVPDSMTASQPHDDMEKRRCANAWATLLELDYYNHPSSQYDTTWPDGQRCTTPEPPFDWTYLVSCSGAETNLKRNGRSDIAALNHMVAMFLFTETVSDLLQRKEAIRVNFMGHPQFNTPHAGSKTMPAFSTFGLSAFHYPKYRIADAAACRRAVDLCQAWIGAPGPDETLQAAREAKAEWTRILRLHLPLLTRRGGGAIEDDIRAWFESETPKAQNRPWEQTVLVLRRELATLDEGGQWDRIIGDPATVRRFEMAVEKEIRDGVFRRINATRNLNLADAFLTSMDAALNETINQLPTRYTRFDPTRIPTIAEADVYAKFVLLKTPAERQKRAACMQRCTDDFLDAIKLIRGFRSRPALENVRKQLGVGIQPEGEQARITPTLSREIARLRGVLDSAAGKLRVRAQVLSEPLAATQNTELVFNDEGGGMERDIQDLCARMRAADGDATIERIMTTAVGAERITQTLTDFLAGGDDKVMEQMVQEFRHDSLDQIQQFQIAETLARRLDPDTLRLFARRAKAHLELGGTLVPIQHPCFMTGGDSADMPQLKRLSAFLTDQNATNRIDFGTPVMTRLLDHFLVFYTETGLLRIDEHLASSSPLRQRYEEEMSKTSYGLHLHKAGAAFFDKDLMERGKKLRGLVDVLTELFFFRVSDGSWQMAPLLASLDGTSRKTDHFKTDGPHLLIVYKDTIGSDQTILITTEFGRKKLIDDAYGFELVSGDVRHILNDIGQEGYVTLLNEYKVRLEGSERAKGIPLDAIFQHVAAREQILNETHQTFLR